MLFRSAGNSGQRPKYEKRAKAVKVSGVGDGSQECHYDCKLPVSFPQKDGRAPAPAVLNTPAVANSSLPGLLGLAALRKNRAILDFTTLQLHFCGPGDVYVDRHLPPGSESFQLELSPSGHIVLPCCEYEGEVLRSLPLC